MKTQKPTLNYFEITKQPASYEEVLRAAQKQGYDYIFRWVNSDQNWTFFQTTSNKAEKGAIQLYMNNKNESDKDFATRFYSESIDIIEVSQALLDLN